MTHAGTEQNFGCEHCWPADANAAWKARRELVHEAELIDELHFHVMILACHDCSQRFVSVFTEMIDWVDSDDPQFWRLLPLTEAEAADLVRKRDSLTEDELATLGPNRRCLCRDYPKGAEPQVLWRYGLVIGPHD